MHERKLIIRVCKDKEGAPAYSVYASIDGSEEMLMMMITDGLLEDPLLDRLFKEFVQAIAESIIRLVSGDKAVVASLEITEHKPETSN